MHTQTSASRVGRRRAEKPKREGVLAPTLATVAAALLAAAAWFFLVRAAIEFGQTALDGRAIAWVFTVAATIGATVCLVLFFSLVHRALRTIGVIADYKPRRVGGRHGR